MLSWSSSAWCKQIVKVLLSSMISPVVFNLIICSPFTYLCKSGQYQDWSAVRSGVKLLRNPMQSQIHMISSSESVNWTLNDGTFLALVCCLGRDNEDYVCIRCKCPRTERWKTNKQCVITRTISDISKCPTSAKNRIVGKKHCFIS